MRPGILRRKVPQLIRVVVTGRNGVVVMVVMVLYGIRMHNFNIDVEHLDPPIGQLQNLNPHFGSITKKEKEENKILK